MTDIVHRLPDVATLKVRCQALAVLDAVLSPRWEGRCYSFDGSWAQQEQMASMRNGCGDGYFVVFTQAGAVIVGFAHESTMSPWRHDPPVLWPGLLAGLPEVFRSPADEPAFGSDGVLQATFCLWRQGQDRRWCFGDIDYSRADPDDVDPDGADWLLGILTDPSPETYLDYAQRCFEVEVDERAVAHVYSSLPLTEDVALALNPRVDLPALAADLARIGFWMR